MLPVTIPQLSLGTAALIIFLVCAAFVMLRGMTRMLLGTIVLALSAWIGIIAWQNAPALSVEWFGKSATIMTVGLPIGAFLISYFIIHKITKIITNPFTGNRNEESGSPSLLKLAFRLIFSLVPTSLIGIIAATLIHHNGAIDEVRSYAQKSLGGTLSTTAKATPSLKSSIEAALPTSWLHVLDPLADPARLKLAKIISAHSETPRNPVIDPKTGKPIPRAIIVDDPELQNLAREGKFGTLLRHPQLTQALNDPKIKALLKDFDL